MAITLNGNGTAVLTDSSGNAGIGTATPTQKLEVAGTIYSTSGGFKFPDATTQTTAATGIPTGTIVAYGSSTTPSGYLKCDGSVYTKSSYTALSTILGSLPANVAQYVNSTSINGVGGAIVLNGNVLLSRGDSNAYVSTNNGASFTTVSYTSSTYPTFGGGTSNYGVWTGTNYILPASGSTVGGIVYNSSLTSVTWTNVTTNVAYYVCGIVNTGSRLIAIETGATFKSSYSTTGGTSWTAGGTHTVNDVRGFQYAAGLAVIVGGTAASAAVITTSPDGATWTARTIPAGVSAGVTRIDSLSYQNSLFIAITNQKDVISSADGITWTYKSTFPGVNISTTAAVIYLSATGYYYTVNYSSTDLITWSLTPNSYKIMQQVAATDGTRIYHPAGTYNPFYAYSTSTQFAVPNFGVSGSAAANLASAYNSANDFNVLPVSYGVTYYIKT